MIWYYAILAAVYLLVPVFISIARVDGESGTISSQEISTFIVVFIIGLCSFKPELHFGLQNGISRKTQFVSFFLSMCIICLGASLVDILLSRLIMILNNSLGSTYYSMFELFYSSRTMFTGPVSRIIVQYFWEFSIMMAAAALGFLITNIYYMFNKMGKVIFSVSVYCGCLFLLPALDVYILDSALSKSLARLLDLVMFGSGTYNPLYTIVFALVGTCILAGLTWLMTRRARVKIR